MFSGLAPLLIILISFDAFIGVRYENCVCAEAFSSLIRIFADFLQAP